MRKETLKIMTIVSGSLVATIGLIAFIISYAMLREVAADYGVGGWLSFLWPLLIDASLIVFTLSYIVSYVAGNDTRFSIVMIVVYTLATIGFNLIHSEVHWINYIVAIVAPLSLSFTTKSLAMQFRDYIVMSQDDPVAVMTGNEPATGDAGGGDRERMTDNDPQNTANEPVKKRPVDQTDHERAANLEAANKVKQQATTETTEAVHRLTASGMSRQQIADELACSLATVTRHRRLAKEQGLNGVVK